MSLLTSVRSVDAFHEISAALPLLKEIAPGPGLSESRQKCVGGYVVPQLRGGSGQERARFVAGVQLKKYDAEPERAFPVRPDALAHGGRTWSSTLF